MASADKGNIMETFPYWLGSFRKDILYNYFKHFLLFAEQINCLLNKCEKDKFLVEINIGTYFSYSI